MTRVGSRFGALEAALLDRLADPVDVGSRKRVSVALEIGPGEGWTFHADHGELMLAHGVDDRANARIVTDADTMVAILRGERSGV
ncbi:MAG TPA: hypothetical protein VHN37_05830, partial [Actinomycetota bacterium]|nr:hypothetical protein [Actinomycetota bacterium]